jgi:hypothetical protein
MILYEFTVVNDNNFSAEEIATVVDGILLFEASEQGWKLGFECKQVGEVEIGPDGNERYEYQVTGEFEEEE